MIEMGYCLQVNHLATSLAGGDSACIHEAEEWNILRWYHDDWNSVRRFIQPHQLNGQTM